MESKEFAAIPIVDLRDFSSASPQDAARTACAVLNSLIRTSAVIVIDPRLTESDFTSCCDMLVKYFSQPYEDLLPDVHPEYHHQVGLSLKGAEGWRRDLLEQALKLPPEHRPHIPPENYPGDPKLRFFIRLGNAQARSAHDPLNQPPVIPKVFKDTWASTMNSWGTKLLTVGENVLTLIENALGTEPGRLSRLTHGAPHLLGPNASNLDQLTVPETIINAYHYDLNLLTIHGPATYPGLRIWLRDGTSLFVKMPPQHLLIQAGQQLEWLTGGLVKAGLHEVVVTEEALAARQRNTSPLRISSPCFMHAASHQLLNIMPEVRFHIEQSDARWHVLEQHYPPILVAEQVERELYKIGLARRR